MSNLEQATLMAYRDGRLTEINPNEDLFLKRVLEENARDLNDPGPGEDYLDQYLERTGFHRFDSFGADRDYLHHVWRNGNKYFIIVSAFEDGYFAFVKLENRIEYMDFARDYLLPLIELEARAEFLMPREEKPGSAKQ